MADSPGCSYGKGTRYVLGIIVTLLVLGASLVGASLNGKGKEIDQNRTDISELKEGFGRVEERVEAQTRILTRIERRLYGEE